MTGQKINPLPFKKVSHRDKKQDILDAYNALLESTQKKRLIDSKPEKEQRRPEGIFKTTLEKLTLAETEISQTAARLKKLEEEIGVKRGNWQKEQNAYKKLQEESKAETAKKRAREEDEYQYFFNQRKKRELDEWEEKKKKLEKDLTDALAQKKQKLEEKEVLLTSQEDELQELQKNASSFEKELAEAIQKSAKEATEKATREAEIERNLFIQQIEGEKELAQLKIKNLEEIVKGQNSQIQSLQAKFDSANRQLKEMAITVIESSSAKEKGREKSEVEKET